MEYKLKKNKFLDWYFSETDDYTELGRYIVATLLEKDTITISIQSILNLSDYIPAFILEKHKDLEDGDEIYDTDDIELID